MTGGKSEIPSLIIKRMTYQTQNDRFLELEVRLVCNTEEPSFSLLFFTSRLILTPKLLHVTINTFVVFF